MAESPQWVALQLQAALLHPPEEGLLAELTALQPEAISQPGAELRAGQLMGAQLQRVVARPLPEQEMEAQPRVAPQPAEGLPREVPVQRVA